MKPLQIRQHDKQITLLTEILNILRRWENGERKAESGSEKKHQESTKEMEKDVPEEKKSSNAGRGARPQKEAIREPSWAPHMPQWYVDKWMEETYAVRKEAEEKEDEQA